MSNLNFSPENGIVRMEAKASNQKPRTLKSPFYKVNEKFEYKLDNQGIIEGVSEEAVRKSVIKLCIKQTKDVAETQYQKEMRSAIFNLLSRFSFLRECRNLGFKDDQVFGVAQNVILYNKLGGVLKKGIEITFKDRLDVLKKEPVYSEADLAEAEFGSIDSITEEQKTELSRFVKGAMALIPAINS